MSHCIETLLTGGEDVEILIINDGSKDRTSEIAESYEQKYPTIVRAINKENGGHGSGVNVGIEQASGLYYKVVDSDDWVDETSYHQILDQLRIFAQSEEPVDMLISNFVYDKEGALHKQVMSYKSAFPQNEVFSWEEVRHLRKGQYILMHSVMYRTQMLRDCGLKLPEHTFYVDNIFVYYPLPYVKKMFYMNVDFYHYYIGREDQSVNEKVMISRIDQQIKVNKIMLESYDLMKDVTDVHLRHYMYNYLEIITTVSTALLVRSGTKEHLEMRKELWQYIREYNKELYRKMRHGVMGITMNLPGKAGRRISVGAYKISQKVVGFN
jgi:glycosyltransferase involved in cell wall biosynthesis